MNEEDDTRPFPIQSGRWKDSRLQKPGSTIPWWLAEVAYEHYSSQYGTDQSLEKLASRGGFGRAELVTLLRKQAR